MDADHWPPGARVRVCPPPLGGGVDGDLLNVPRYVWGCVGTVVGVVTGARYEVRFAAQELWGDGDHEVTVDLDERYLELAGEGPLAPKSAR
jgi:hypothetical protein